MHAGSMLLMGAGLRRALWPEARVLDVGSLDLNGSFRRLVKERGWDYVGLDIVAGRNVDIVAPEYDYPFGDGEFDVVISGSTMEHVKAIWKWVPELVRVLGAGGLLVLVTHTRWGEHRHPVDCWRVMPDGMRFLFDETGALEDYVIRTWGEATIMGSAFKVGG